MGQKTRATLKQEWLQHLWLQQNRNAAALQLEHPMNYTHISASYQTETGDFHRAMDANAERTGLLNIEGGVKLSDYYVWGRFDYTRRGLKDVGFNASILDPYRGMPYFVTDLNSSNWLHQYYDLDFKVALPRLSDHLSVGLAGGYKAGSGAKQRDIRAESYAMDLYLEPSLLISFSPRYHLGLTFLYGSHKEENNMHNVNLYIDQDYYEHFGMGYGNRRIGSGRMTDYVGHSLGSGVQLGYEGSQVKALLDGSYRLRIEGANSSLTNPKEIGTTRAHLLDIALRINSITSSSHTHHFIAEYQRHSNEGIQHITQYDNTESFKGYVTLLKNVRLRDLLQRVALGYTYMRGNDREYLWTIGAKAELTQNSTKYLLPVSQKQSKKLCFSLDGARNWIIKDDLIQRLELSGSLSYNTPISESADYHATSTEPTLVEQIELPDHHFYNTSFADVMFSLTYSRQVHRQTSAMIYLSVNGDYKRAIQSDLFKYRLNWALSIGLIF